MSSFGIVDLGTTSEVPRYVPPAALVTTFKLFHKEDDNTLLPAMKLLANKDASAAITKLRNTAERPKAERIPLKAITADGIELTVVQDATIVGESLNETTEMRIPFFQYSDKAEFRRLELLGTDYSQIVQSTVNLDTIRLPPAKAPSAGFSYSFALASDHPGVQFLDKRSARFGGLTVGPMEDE